jgi:hypothetical protein
MTQFDFGGEYDYTQRATRSGDLRAGWILVILVNLCLIVLTI